MYSFYIEIVCLSTTFLHHNYYTYFTLAFFGERGILPPMNAKILTSLVEKFHPSKIAMHPKTAFLVGALLGQDWATGPHGEKSPGVSFTITADEFVISGNMFLGEWEEIRTNLRDAANQVKLTVEEKEGFNELFQDKFTDCRNLIYGRKVVPLLPFFLDISQKTVLS